MKKIMISSVAAFAFFAIAGSVSAVSATEIYTPSTGFLKYGSGMGAKVSQMSNVMAAQKALNVCTNSSLVVDGKMGINTTGVFKSFQTSKGIAADGVIGPVTAGKLADCSVGTSTDTGSSSTLSGGAGDLQDVRELSTYSNEKVKEGQNDAKVLAFEIEADNGSDLLISNVRLSLEQTGAGSKRMNKYIDGVKVWQDSKEVGSADTSDFSESSDVYSRSINLSNAVVKDGEKSKFYVSVDAISNIDSNDLGEDWDVTLDSIRFKDASGAIITDSVTGDLTSGVTKSFSFEDLTTSGDLELKVTKGTNSPIAQVIEADSVSDTNDVTLVEAKIKASGTDMAIDEIKFDVTPTGANSNEIVKEYKLMVDGKEIDSVDSPSIASTVTGYVTFTDLKDDFMIDMDDTVTVKLVADINDFDGNFGNGDSILASLKTSGGTEFSVEDENGDDVDASDWTGSAVGEAQTFFEDGIMVKLVSTSAVKTPGDATATESDSGLFTITFDVTAFGNHVYIDKTAPVVGGANASAIVVSGTGTVTSEITSPSGADEKTNSFLVEEGTTERFTISVNILATATGFFKVELGNIAYALTDVNTTTTYSSDLSNFKTTSLSLTDR